MAITQGFLGGLRAGQDQQRLGLEQQVLSEGRRQFDLQNQQVRQAFVSEQTQKILQSMQQSAAPLIALGRTDAVQGVIKSYVPGLEQMAKSADLFGTGEGDFIRRQAEAVAQGLLAQPTAAEAAVGTGQAAAAQETAQAQALGIQPASAFAQETARAESQANIGLMAAQRAAQNALAEKYRAEARATTTTGLTSSLVDESGNVKPDVSTKLHSEITSLMDPAARISPTTGEILDSTLTPEGAQTRAQITALAGEIIRQQGARSIPEAVLMATGAIPIPREQAQAVPLSAEKRQELLDKNAEIHLLLPDMQELIAASSKSTGLLSAGQAGLDATLGQFLNFFGREEALFEDTQLARQAIRTFNQRVKGAIVNSNRFPEWEQKIINNQLVDPDEWFADPPTAQKKMQGLFAELQALLGKNNRLLSGQGLQAIDVRRPGLVETPQTQQTSPTPTQAQPATATNPQTGEKMIWDEGKRTWVSVAQAQKNQQAKLASPVPLR